MAREATKATKTATPDQLLAPPNSPRAPASSKKSAWCRPEVEANRRISLLAILKTPATFSVVFKPAPLRSGRWDRGSLVRRLEIQHSTMRIHNTFYHTSTKIICLPPPIKKPKYERLHWLYRYLNDSPILSPFSLSNRADSAAREEIRVEFRPETSASFPLFAVRRNCRRNTKKRFPSAEEDSCKRRIRSSKRKPGFASDSDRRWRGR